MIFLLNLLFVAIESGDAFGNVIADRIQATCSICDMEIQTVTIPLRNDIIRREFAVYPMFFLTSILTFGLFLANFKRLFLGGGGGRPDYLQKLKVPEGYEKMIDYSNI